ncbi:TIR domain-containing protein [Sphingomonas sp. Mn802worker]|uniref:TIR domain-containing protein n=1 Tax=Sphingomonas sp. Mn802worker TaxID=629773 RepID=UPI000A04F24C|nr:TIR domain-containing protein [Sphingomonas sp. Mn802worker]
MAEPRAFISFDVDNNSTEKMLFAGQAWHSKTPFSHQDWSAKEPMKQSEWEGLVKAKINKTHLMIVLVGKYMSTATGVAKEIAMAKSQNVPFFGVYVGGADATSPLPSGLVRSRVIPWTWDGVAGAVSQMMKEGKNA